MANIKSVAWYVIGLIGVIIFAWASTGEYEVTINPLPTNTPIPTEEIEADPTCEPPVRHPAGKPEHVPLTSAMIQPDTAGERLQVSGTVYTEEDQQPVPGVWITVWQADPAGNYPDADSTLFRAKFQTDAAGRYRFNTVKPGATPVGCTVMLPARINYEIQSGDRPPFRVSLFFQGDPHLENVPPISPRSLRPLTVRQEPEGPMLYTTFDIELPKQFAIRR